MPDSTQPPPERLGAALVIGGDACRCVHVHTDQTGLAAIWARLDELTADDTGTARIAVVSVLGRADAPDGPLPHVRAWAIPADAVEALVAATLGENR